MTPTSSAPKLTRRTILKVTVAAGGGLILSLSIPRLKAALAAELDADFAPNAFVRIDPDGKVTFTIPQVEMGQGIYTALSMILAEELDAPFEQVTAVAAPSNDKLYANPLLGFQVTGGSTSVRAFWKPMRIAGASARALLVQAAAAKWSVDPSSCRTENGEVLHDASSRKAAYGELTQAAAALTPPQNLPLKSPRELQAYRQIAQATRHARQGQRQSRLRHRRATAGREDRDACELPRVRGQDRACRRRAGEDRAGGPAGRRSRRSRRGRRRPHVGRQAGPRRPRHHVGRRAERRRVDVRCAERPCRRKRESGRGREVDRRRRQGSGRGDEARRDLSRAVPRPRADGAGQLHRTRSLRRL